MSDKYYELRINREGGIIEKISTSFRDDHNGYDVILSMMYDKNKKTYIFYSEIDDHLSKKTYEVEVQDLYTTYIDSEKLIDGHINILKTSIGNITLTSILNGSYSEYFIMFYSLNDDTIFILNVPHLNYKKFLVFCGVMYEHNGAMVSSSVSK